MDRAVLGSLCQAVDRSTLQTRARSFPQAYVVYFTEIRMSAPQPAHKARKENRMKNCNASEIQIMRRILPIACATALAVACTASLAQSVQDGGVTITPPPVPANIQIPLGNTAFLVGHAVGTQNYICLPSGTGFKFTLFTPQATLFNNADKEVITHYFSPNPVEGGTIRATWQHSR